MMPNLLGNGNQQWNLNVIAAIVDTDFQHFNI